LAATCFALFDELTAQRHGQNDLVFQRLAKRIKRGAGKEFEEYVEKAATRAKLSRKDKQTIILNGFMDAWRHSDQKKPMLEACIRAGIEPIGFHQLRHTFTERLLRLGVQRRYVADVLGHRDTRMLDLHYEHISNDDKAQAIRAAMAGRGQLNVPVFQKLKPKRPKYE
jgi:integrase